MTNFIIKLENKFRKYAISNLPIIMICLYAAGYVMQLVNSRVVFYLSLDPYKILHGEVWRLVTWLLIPEPTRNMFFFLLMLYFYMSIGLSLERTWGKFYFNLYIFSGIIITVISAFVLYGLVVLTDGSFAGLFNNVGIDDYGAAIYQVFGPAGFSKWISLLFSTFYINMSIFLAFASTYPDVEVYVFFILPVKVKVLGIIWAIYLGYEALNNDCWTVSLWVLGASLLNFILYFFLVRPIHLRIRRSRAQARAAAEFKRKMAPSMKPESKIAKHKCAVCGQTSETNPDLTFRFCSKCVGNYEYCQEHLFTHTHIQER